MSRNKITYRFEQPVLPAPEAPPSGRLSAETADAEDGHVIPLFREDVAGRRYVPRLNEAEADRIERLILESTHAWPPDDSGTEGDGTGGEPGLPETVLYRRNRSRRRKDGAALLMSGLGAILTGVLIGSFVFQFFRGEPDAPVVPVAENGSALPGISEPDWTEGAGPDLLPWTGEGTDFGETGRTDAWSRLPEQTYYVVQHGVFSSQDGADAAAGQLREKGWAGAVDGQRFAVYAGIADDRDDALLIARQLEAEQLEVFIKPFVLPAATLPGDVTETFAAYVAESRSFMDLVLDVSLLHLYEAAPGAMADGRWEELKEAHRRLTERTNVLPDMAGSAAQRAVQAMNRSADSAMAAMEQYAKKPSAAYLWQAQSALLDHLIAQKQLLDMLVRDEPPGTGTETPAGHPA